MFILQKKSSILLILLFLSSCYFFAPIEPIAKIDNMVEKLEEQKENITKV